MRDALNKISLFIIRQIVHYKIDLLCSVSRAGFSVPFHESSFSKALQPI